MSLSRTIIKTSVGVTIGGIVLGGFGAGMTIIVGGLSSPLVVPVAIGGAVIGSAYGGFHFTLMLRHLLRLLALP